MNKTYIGYGVGVLVVVAVFFVWVMGWYPVAQVNGTLVSARDYRMQFRIAYSYYHADGFEQLFDTEEQIAAVEDDVIAERVMESVVDATLIDTYLRAQVSDYEKTLEEQASALSSDEVLSKYVTYLSQVADVSVATIEQYFLVDRVRYQLLEEQLQDTASEWLVEARAQAEVTLFYPGFVWRDGSAHIQ
jgi:hypothetical protein